MSCRDGQPLLSACGCRRISCGLVSRLPAHQKMLGPGSHTQACCIVYEQGGLVGMALLLLLTAQDGEDDGALKPWKTEQRGCPRLGQWLGGG